MADNNVVQSSQAPVSAFDTLGKLQGKLAQLTAILNSIYGGGFESFQCLNDTLQENILWACADLSEDCERLADSLTPANVQCSEVQHG